MTPYRADIERAAVAHGIDPDLVEAVVTQESGGRADAFRFEPDFYPRYLARNPFYVAFGNVRRVSSSYGLMQIMFPTAVDHGFTAQPEYLFLPSVNLDMGCRILAKLLTTLRLAPALQAYNGGKGGIGKPEPAAYARSVLGHLERIKAARTRSKVDVGADVPGGGAA